MKPPRFKLVMICFGVFVLGGMLIAVSQSVQQAETELAGIEAKLRYEERALRVLQTEWAFLNNPERLEFFAREHLGLLPPDPASLRDAVQPPEHVVLPLTPAGLPPRPEPGEAH